MKIEAYFTNIRQEILKELEKAQKQITIAVCWFTNFELFDKLCEKLVNGIPVDLIILDDYINCNPYGCDFSKFIELGGGLFLSSTDRPMHNKYCIIDDNVLINGSYNWTYFAESKNDENIMIIEGNEKLIQEYNDDFLRLVTHCEIAWTFRKRQLLYLQNIEKENKERNVFGVFNMLSNDLFYKAVETNDKTFYNVALSIIPNNTFFQQKAIELNWEKPIKLNATLSEGIIGNKICMIFPIGAQLPTKCERNYNTVSDNQVSMTATILKGESEFASLNNRLFYYTINGIPPLKAGEANIKTKYELGLDGILYITKYIHDTGLIDFKQFNLKKLNVLVNE